MRDKNIHGMLWAVRTRSALWSALLLGGLLGLACLAALSGAVPSAAAAPGAQLWVTPLGLDFGPVGVGETSPAQTITLTNVGSAALSGFTPQPPNDSQFQIQSDCGAGLAPGASCTYAVRFAPTRTGTASGTSETITQVAIFSFVMRGDGVGPAVSYSGRWLDFGAVPVGSRSQPQTVVVSNTGRLALAGFGGGAPANADFALAHDCAAGLPIGDACALQFDFAPSRIGAVTTESAPSFDGPELRVVLSGVGTLPYRAVARSLDFGVQAVGETSPELAVALQNVGQVPLVDWAAGPPSDPRFAVSHDCAPALAPGASCTLGFTFAPATTGLAAATASLAFGPAGSTATQELTVDLQGFGAATADVRPGYLAVSPRAIDFGTVAVGSQGDQASIALVNATEAAATITPGTPSDNQFFLSQTCAAGLAPGDGCAFALRFRPLTPGLHRATLVNSATYRDGGDNVIGSETFTLTVAGFATPGLAWSPRVLAFAPVGVGASSPPLTVEVRSLGPALVNVVSPAAPAPFASSQNCGAGVEPLGSCRQIVRFAPTETGRYTATVASATSVGGFTTTLLGTGQGATLWVTPTILDFGTVDVGTMALSQTITVRNPGLAPLTLRGIPVPEDEHFTVASDCPAALPAGAACTLTYGFRPTGPGLVLSTAQLQTGSGNRILRVRGTGVANDPGTDNRLYLPYVGRR